MEIKTVEAGGGPGPDRLDRRWGFTIFDRSGTWRSEIGPRVHALGNVGNSKKTQKIIVIFNKNFNKKNDNLRVELQNLFEKMKKNEI